LLKFNVKITVLISKLVQGSVSQISQFLSKGSQTNTFLPLESPVFEDAEECGDTHYKNLSQSRKNDINMLIFNCIEKM
jgi:hypothetical protein